MKLKFDKEVDQVINAIAGLPDEVTTDEVRNKPVTLVRELEEKIKYQLNTKQMPSKQHAKIRRQISFLWEHLLMVRKAIMANEGLNPNLQSDRNKPINEFNVYKLFVKSIKNIKSEEGLKTLGLIRVGLKYGVVFLSDHEIQGLIDRNIPS